MFFSQNLKIKSISLILSLGISVITGVAAVTDNEEEPFLKQIIINGDSVINMPAGEDNFRQHGTIILHLN